MTKRPLTTDDINGPGYILGREGETINALRAELAQAHEELREANKALVQWHDDYRNLKQRAESAEAKNLELAAQVAVMANSLKKLKKLFNDFPRPNSEVILFVVDEALASLPAEAEKLLRVAEAAIAISKHASWPKKNHKNHTPTNVLINMRVEEYEAFMDSIRDLRGDKP